MYAYIYDPPCMNTYTNYNKLLVNLLKFIHTSFKIVIIMKLKKKFIMRAIKKILIPTKKKKQSKGHLLNTTASRYTHSERRRLRGTMEYTRVHEGMGHNKRAGG